MKKVLALLVCMLGVHTIAEAQYVNIYASGENQQTYATSEVDSVVIDSRENFWKNATKTVSYYYAPSWNKIADPAVTVKNDTYTIPLNAATSAQWQAQTFFTTNIPTDSHKRYDFCLTLKASKAISNATVKLYQDGDDKLYYFEDRINLTAGKEYLFRKTEMNGIDMTKVSLVLDFGGNAASTIVELGNIALMESSYDSSKNRSVHSLVTH